MSKAKTKRFISILCTIFSAIFAFSVAGVFAYSDITISRSTDTNSVSAYLGNNDYSLINDSEIAPIAYSEGAHSSELALQYSIDYDFNVKIQYHILWSDSSTDSSNVILNFVDRSNWFVDNSYMYHSTYIPKGTGKLGIIGSVDFVDSKIESLYGKSLQIVVDKLTVLPKNSSTSLQADNSTAWDLFNNYQNRASTIASNKAYVAVYNNIYDYSHGISHPNAQTAYHKTIDSNTITNATWLGGNRYYTGIATHVVTGATPVKLSVTVTGDWQNSLGGSSANVVPIDNIKFNYSSNWIYSSDTQDGVFETRYFNFVIPANSAIYLPIVDNVQITSMGYVVNTSYVGTKIVAGVNLNGVDFTNSRISSALIDTAATSATTNYSASDISIVNSSLYENNLYDSTITGNVSQNYFTDVSIINNTMEDKIVNISYSCTYMIPNGYTSITKADDETQFINASNIYKEYSSSLDISAYSLSTLGGTTLLIPAQSLVEACAMFTVNSTMASIISGLGFGGYYDAWLSLNVSTSVSSSPTNTLAVETSVVKNGSVDTISIRLKNNTNKVASSINVNLTIYKLTITTTQILNSTAPTNWKYTYWQYYKESSATNPCYYNSSNVEEQMFSAPTYSAGYWLKEASYGIMGGYSISAPVSINPYSSVLLTFTVNGTNNASLSTTANDNYKIVASVTSTLSTASSVYIANDGTSQARLVNPSSTAYFVRFNGNCQTQSNLLASGGYNYYLGVLQPNQVIDLSMSSASSSLDTAIASNYPSSISSWASTFKSRLSGLFADHSN